MENKNVTAHSVRHPEHSEGTPTSGTVLNGGDPSLRSGRRASSYIKTLQKLLKSMRMRCYQPRILIALPEFTW